MAAAALTSASCGPGTGAAAPAVPTEPVDLGAATQIPVGGAELFRERKLLVSQPEKGRFTAFSAVCTHAGCVVDSVADGTANCPCHGSRFHITDGTVAQGPADKALPAIPVRVEDGRITVGGKPKDDWRTTGGGAPGRPRRPAPPH
ncbi:Rieske (2Fe-2S) protein [Wenjunlia tyrosinilytica]|uniref:Rieske (2Fe-2S) protein n=1 Tax=Wenjunlia tyrosinilytica TaxID=1544741 RepID=UPI001E61017A|nr:Rieske (2Fe-2S) protein [Wenjunlia tyrosinilytica]